MKAPMRGTPAAIMALLICTVASQGRSYGQQPHTSSLAPQAVLQQIAALLADENLPAAGAAVEQALQRHPQDPAVHNLAGVVDAQQGAFDEAESHFLRAIELAPHAPSAYENLGRLYQERTAVDPRARTKALDTYRRLLGVVPDNVEALFQAGVLLALEGRFGESLVLLERLPSRLHERPQVQAVAATARGGTDDLQGASKAASEVAAHPDLSESDVLAIAPAFDHLQNQELAPALQMLEALVRRDLASPAALHRLGALYIRTGRAGEALTLLERAAARGVSVPLLIDLARAASKADEQERALGYLGHARALEPENAQVHFLFGIVCVQLDLVAEAHESLAKAVALAPDSAPVNYAMGSVSLHRRDPSEALPYFEKYVRLEPDDPRGRFALGVARFFSRDLEGARRELAQVASVPATAAGANYFLARIARQSNDLATARRAVEEALRHNPQYPDAWAELGLLQTRAGAFSEAEESLRKALSIAPDHYLATVNLTALYTRTRDPRREQQAAALAALQQKREQQAQELLRMVEVVPQ